MVGPCKSPHSLSWQLEAIGITGAAMISFYAAEASSGRAGSVIQSKPMGVQPGSSARKTAAQCGEAQGLLTKKLLCSRCFYYWGQLEVGVTAAAALILTPRCFVTQYWGWEPGWLGTV